jgi:hypothetical protein
MHWYEDDGFRSDFSETMFSRRGQRDVMAEAASETPSAKSGTPAPSREAWATDWPSARGAPGLFWAAVAVQCALLPPLLIRALHRLRPGSTTDHRPCTSDLSSTHHHH